jgi:hypothetical protein
MNRIVAAKCLGQATGEDRVSLFIHTKCSTVVISLLIISCGLRVAHEPWHHHTGCSCLFCGPSVASKAGPSFGSRGPGN